VVAVYSLGAITVDDRGVGIYNLGTATVQESTLSGNSAGFGGGGIFNDVGGLLAVKGSTVTGSAARPGPTCLPSVRSPPMTAPSA
jgi:hypothetical protein